MIKTIIIEDEINARSALKKMLKLLAPSLQIIGETGFVENAVSQIKTIQPDLVFMDIELEDGTGFDILKKLDQIDFKIIFTTAYSQYAIKAFKFSAIDYLLKPIDPTELQTAINKAISDIDSQKQHLELLAVLQSNINKKEPKIVLKTTEQCHIIKVKDIVRLEADGAYTCFVTTDKKIIVSKNIKYYQDILDDNFIRSHQSHLVNSKRIVGIDKNGYLQMSNHDKVAISLRKKSEIMNFIKNF